VPTLARICLLPILVSLVDCGSDGPGPSSGVPRTALVSSLTPDQAAALCDWSAAVWGGYGQSRVCSDHTMTTTANRQACVGSLPLTEQLCPALTVADVEDCSNAIGTDICAFEAAPQCANYAACFDGAL
jgi:hypothetical protein